MKFLKLDHHAVKTRPTYRAFAFVSVMISIILFHLTASAAYIGSSIEDYQSDDGKISGVRVIAIDANGPAAKAGLKEGDIILSANSGAFGSAESFAKMIQETPTGASLNLSVLRNGQRLNLTLIPSEMPQYVIFYRQGREQAKNNNNEEAIDSFTKAIDLDPKSAEAYYGRGHSYMQMKQYDEAISDYSKYIELIPTPYGYHDRGRAYQEKNLYDAAISDYSKAIEMNPTFPLSAIIYTDRGFLYYHTGSYDRAIADFSSAIKISPQDALAYEMRGHAFMMKQEQEQAHGDFESAAKLYIAKGVEITKNGDYEAAIRIFTMGIKLDTKYSPSLYYQRGLIYEKKGDYFSAVSDYSEAIRREPGFSDAYKQRGNLYAQKLGDSEKAKRDWEKAASLSREGNLQLVETSASRRSSTPPSGSANVDSSVKAAPKATIEDVFTAEPSIRILKMETKPTPVKAGSTFDLEITFIVTDSSLNNNSIPVLFDFTILGDKEIEFEQKGKEIEGYNGQTSVKTLGLSAPKKTGIYLIRGFLEYKGKRSEDFTKFTIE